MTFSRRDFVKTSVIGSVAAGVGATHVPSSKAPVTFSAITPTHRAPMEEFAVEVEAISGAGGESHRSARIIC